ncbi:MAG: type I-D CRISPR-associated endonuclease Cas1d [Chloroflexia bacterium]
MTTLYLTEQHATVHLDGEALLVRIPADKQAGVEARKVRVPLTQVEQVVVLGNITLTTPVLAALLERRIEVAFCSPWGRFLGRLSPPMSKNAPLRLAQHRAHNDPAVRLALAARFVRGKVANMRTFLLRQNRKRADAEVARACRSLQDVLWQIEAASSENTTMDTLLGWEGTASAHYFGVFGRLLAPGWEFPGRLRRPPPDPVNALLSFGYTVLTNDVASAVDVVGLDPLVGFLHAPGYGRPCLALDLVEEFRPLVVDSVVLRVINNGILQPDDFEREVGSCLLRADARRRYIEQLEGRLNEEIQHPVFGYKATYRRCLELQARLLAKTLLGEIPAYPPFTVR